MRIICGTDFSERGRQAAEVAALLAARSGGRMTLLHALDARGGGLGAAHVLQTLETAARERLDDEARHLRALGAAVDVIIPDGWPDEAVLADAARHDNSIVVLSATGARDGAGVSVGKTCERTLSRTTVPMLVVRDPAPLVEWLRGERTLRVLVAFDFSVQSASALAFAARVAKLGPSTIIAAYTADPRREASRMGLQDSPDAVQERVRLALAERVAQLEPELAVDIFVAPHQGDPGARLAHLAERESIDLMISGTHQRGALQRLFTGSVSL
ncbi:MAG: universal stress protein, partial [Gammaproteobacteria bacterium]